MARFNFKLFLTKVPCSYNRNCDNRNSPNTTADIMTSTIDQQCSNQTQFTTDFTSAIINNTNTTQNSNETTMSKFNCSEYGFFGKYCDGNLPLFFRLCI